MSKRIFMYCEMTHPVRNDKTRFTVTYTAYGVKFKTDIDEPDKDCAKAFFRKFYPSARFEKIQIKSDQK